MTPLWKRRGFRKPLRVAVLGCGPAGLFATHALKENGCDVTVFSKMRQSQLFGCQYLHAPIPGLTIGDPVDVKYILRGGVFDYRDKVYGPTPVKTSVETLDADHQAWDIRAAYGMAWGIYKPLIVNVPDITPNWIEEHLIGLGKFDLMVSSIPAPAICYDDKHQFHSQKIWALGDAPELDRWCPVDLGLSNTVVCDGTRDTGWYRWSSVFGYKTAEWPERRKPPLPGVAEVEKPIKTDCDCWTHPDPGVTGIRTLKVGRYGRWEKGVLSQSAYLQASKI